MSLLQSEKFNFFRQSTILCLIVAFVGIKWLQIELAEDSLRHLLVAVFLLALPAVFDTSSLRSSFRQVLISRLRSEDVLVLAFFLLPLLLNLLFFAESWPQTKMNWQAWLFSRLGLLSVVSAPIAEEYFFRGWLLKRQLQAQNGLSQGSFWGAIKICYINALVFWVMHMPTDLHSWKQALMLGAVPASPGPFLLGLMTSVLTLRTGHLRAALLFHAIANAGGPLWWPLLGSDALRSVFYN